MTFVLGSTTEDAAELQRVATSENWRVAPKKPDAQPGPGDVPKDTPQRVFNEWREKGIKEKEEAGPVLFRGEERKPERWRERIEKSTQESEAAENRALEKEEQLKELEALDGNGAAPAETQTPSVSTEREIGAHERFKRGSAKYSDYGAAVEEGHRQGLAVSGRAAVAIEASRNSEDVIYFLLKNPEVCHELLTDPDSGTQRVGELSKYLMEHPEALAQAQRPQAGQADPETVQLQEKFDRHYKATEKLLAARRDGQELVRAAQNDGGISPAVNVAVVEQENGPEVLLHLLEKPELRAELNRLSYPAAMARVSRIAAQLESKAAAGRERARPPEPISPVGASSTRSGSSIFDPNVPMSTFIRERNKQELARKRAGR